MIKSSAMLNEAKNSIVNEQNKRTKRGRMVEDYGNEINIECDISEYKLTSDCFSEFCDGKSPSFGHVKFNWCLVYYKRFPYTDKIQRNSTDA